jgi:SAM-dependent methyltransferase
MKTAIRPCPICDEGSVQSLRYQRFALPDGHPLSNGYEVVCCVYCGFVYADTSVSQEAYNLFYARYSKYEDKQIGTGGLEQEWDRDRVKATAEQIANFLKDPTATVLDVGCANGGLLKALHDLGYTNVMGIDPSPACVENTRQRGVAAEVGSLSQPLLHEAFDCIVLSHTLEHVQDLRLAAQWLTSLMHDNSVLYLEVPDASRYKDFIDAPFQDFNTEHINHFSMAALKNYLAKNGFESEAGGEKIIPASANKPYPSIFCLARKSGTIRDLERDDFLRGHIDEYIARSQEILDRIASKIRSILANNNRLIIWGTGQLTLKLLVETSLSDAEIVAFVDSNPNNHGKTLRGVTILSPEQIRAFSEPILISSTLHQQAIKAQISRMGLDNPLLMLEDG